MTLNWTSFINCSVTGSGINAGGGAVSASQLVAEDSQFIGCEARNPGSIGDFGYGGSITAGR